MRSVTNTLEASVHPFTYMYLQSPSCLHTDHCTSSWQSKKFYYNYPLAPTDQYVKYLLFIGRLVAQKETQHLALSPLTELTQPKKKGGGEGGGREVKVKSLWEVSVTVRPLHQMFDCFKTSQTKQL